MPKKAIKTKTKTKSKPKTKTNIKSTNKNTNINNVHVHVEKPKTRKKRTTKPKTNISNINPIASSSSLSQGVSQKINHQRGLINNEIQQPTIIQQIQSLPDPRLDKLEKRTKKLKEQLKENKNSTSSQTQTEQRFQDAFETPSGPRNTNSRLITEENITPNKINFKESSTSKPKKKGFFDFFSSSKKKVPEIEMSKREKDPFKDSIEPSQPQPLLALEYKPESIYISEKPPATAPEFKQSPTGRRITQELKNLVNEIHAANPNKKMIQGPFKQKISVKLRELGVEPSHTAQYLKDMNLFYKEIFDASRDIQPA
jgi:hypothetical protein